MRDGRAYLRFVSDLWTTVFADSASLSLLVGVQADLFNRIYLQAVQAASIEFADTVNVFREDFWNIVTIRSDERIATSDPSLYRYALSRPYERIPFLYNKIFEPSFRMMSGVDYSLETVWADSSDVSRSGTITFKSDPFANNLVPKRVIGRSNGEDVVELALFAPRVLVDEQDIWRTWGHLVNVFQPSSENYRQLVYGILYIYMHGPVIHPLNAGLNMACGYPVARDVEEVLSTETVDDSDTEGHYVVRTAANTYRVPFRIMNRLGTAQRVPTLSVKGREGDRPGTMLKPLDPFIKDIQVVDWLTPGYETWWKGDGTNRVVNFLPPELVPEMDFLLRDDVNVIDHFFEHFFKYATFAANINTMAITNFNAVDDFFEVLYDVKPAYTAPYSNAFFDPSEKIFHDGDDQTLPDAFTYEDRHDREDRLAEEGSSGVFGWGDHERVLEDAGSVREGLQAEIEWDEPYRGRLPRILGALTPVFADPADLYNPAGLMYVHRQSTAERRRFTNDIGQAMLASKFRLGISRGQFLPYNDTARDQFTVDSELWLSPVLEDGTPSGSGYVERFGFYGGRILLGSRIRMGLHAQGHLVEGMLMDASFEIEDTMLVPSEAEPMVYLEEVLLDAPVVTGTLVSYIEKPRITGELEY